MTNSDKTGRRRRQRYRTGLDPVDAKIAELVDLVTDGENGDVIAELLAASCRLALDEPGRGDLKLASTAVRDLRTVLLTFVPFRHVRKVTVFGSARLAENDPLYDWTADLARSFASRGWMVVTGAGPGIMAACIEGAGPEASIGVAIQLPWENEPAPLIAGDPKLVLARHFFIRKLGLVKESHAFVCLPGGFGTLDEMFEVLTLGTRGKGQIAPIYLLERPDSHFWQPLLDYFTGHLAARQYVGSDEIDVLRHSVDIQEVVEGCEQFYSNYDSMRYVGQSLLLRVRHRPSDTILDGISTKFSDLLIDSEISVLEASSRSDLLPTGLFGIRLHFDRHSFGRLYELIDYLNADHGVATP